MRHAEDQHAGGLHLLGAPPLAALLSQWRNGRRELGLSARTIQRHRKLGGALDLHEELLDAVQSGLDLDSAVSFGELAETGVEVRGWVALAGHLGSGEAQRLAARSRDHSPRRKRKQTQARIDRAAHVLGKLEAGEGIGARGPVQPGEASVAGAPFRVTGPVEPEVREPQPSDLTWGHPRLLEAVRWFLRHEQIPVQHGCGKAKQRQRWMCQNPECRRVTLRNQVHHIWHLEHGAGDGEDNLITVCKSCHLRLIHSGRVWVCRVDGALVWRFPGRAVVVLP